MQFTPLVDFRDDDLKSDYCAGLNYTVRPGNTVLAEKVEEWLRECKIALRTAEGQQTTGARIKGVAKVT